MSIGFSADGSAAVAILGHTDRTDSAAQQAQQYVLKGRDPAVIGCANDIGAVIMDHSSATAVAVMPPIGRRQVFWSASADVFALSSDPRRLIVAGGGAPSVVPDVFFRYLYFHMLPGPGAVFAGTAKLEGGHWLRWNGPRTNLYRYWRPRFEDVAGMSEVDASAELHAVLRDSVARALDPAGPAGTFLSGGLDSSTVAGLAAQLRPGISTISMGFDAAGYDEMEYARIASRHFRTNPLEYYVTPDDVLATLPAIAVAFPEPFGNSSAAAAYHCARIGREHGLQLLLAGDGGDELFGGNDRYAKQLVFEHYHRLPRAARTRLLEPLVATARRLSTNALFRKAQSYIDQSNVPLPDRLQGYNFLHRHDPSEVFAPDLLEQTDPAAPLRMLRDEYAVPQCSSTVNRMLFLDWKFTLHDNDLVKVNTACQLAGVDVAYPMLDQAVVDFSLRVPDDWKVQHGQLRWFYKRAMRNFLPDEILRKTKHGFGLPFGIWTRTHDGLSVLSQDALESLGQRGVFRPEFLREALRLHREGHAAYYGELVWILMVLELWLQAHMPNLRL